MTFHASFARSLGLMILLAGAAACAKKDKPATAGKDAGVAKAIAADAAPVPVATADAAAAPTAPAATGGGLDGPHASIDAYCTKRSAGFDAGDCSYGDETEMCSCAPASKDDVDGPLTAKASGGDLSETALLLTAASAADYATCEVAIKVPAGWYVLPDAFPCGPAPASHDGGIAAKITRFDATGSELKLAWTQQSTGGDKPGKPEAFELSCTVASGAAPTCTPATATP